MPATDTAAPRWALVVHGGAGIMSRGSLSEAEDAAFRAGLQAALDAGSSVLKANGTALDAAEASIRVLEDDPLFNAGHGAVFTAEGGNELDAAIMDGSDRRAGAVAGVTRTRNPISLARAVLEHSPHVLLARDGADAFSTEQGLEQVDPAYFRTEERWRQLQEMKARGPDAVFDVALKYGTVGAVACDASGHVAAGTSTGGLTGKRWGRIGDSPLIGAGTYADDRAGAVSATGSGEYFIRVAAAHEIGARVRLAGDTLQAAVDAVVQDELKPMGGHGGVIAVGPDGAMAWSFNTPGLYRGRVSADTEAVTAIYSDEI
jgi:beta-aspartyl-peptidase (threonine type)